MTSHSSTSFAFWVRKAGQYAWPQAASQIVTQPQCFMLDKFTHVTFELNVSRVLQCFAVLKSVNLVIICVVIGITYPHARSANWHPFFKPDILNPKKGLFKAAGETLLPTSTWSWHSPQSSWTSNLDSVQQDDNTMTNCIIKKSCSIVCINSHYRLAITTLRSFLICSLKLCTLEDWNWKSLALVVSFLAALHNELVR